MLKQRVVTGVLLAAVAAWVLIGWSDLFFAIFLLAFTAIGLWEWGKLSNVVPRSLCTAFAVIATITVAASMYLSSYASLKAMALIGLVLWLAIAADLLLRPVAEQLDDESTRWVSLTVGAFQIILTICCMYWLRQQYGVGVVIYATVLVAAADIGAYFAGKKFGKRQLAPAISAGKTIEGAVGGLVLASLIAVVATAFLQHDHPWALALMGMLAAAFSIFGDLFISRAKRASGVKDSGMMLPGHGGVLDRFDGLLAAMPFVAFAVLWL